MKGGEFGFLVVCGVEFVGYVFGLLVGKMVYLS